VTAGVLKMTKLTFCMMTQNRLFEVIHNVEKTLPYVDRVVIVDGGSVDDTIFYMRNWAKEESKIEFYVHPWADNFSAQRNNYLSKVEDNSWCLVADPDEVFEVETLRQLQNLVTEAEKQNRDMVGFQCRSQSYRGNKVVWESLDNYWKRLLFRKYPQTTYSGNPHERLRGHPERIMDTKFVYEHRKQDNIIWHRGARNLFVNGGGPNLGRHNPRWVELRTICSVLGIETWHQFDAYLIKGNADQRVKDWLIAQHDADFGDGSSEHRESYKLYFRIYHPEEEPAELKSKHIP
jgi:glycosyltransferase involved in cell wall biosynthesis